MFTPRTIGPRNVASVPQDKEDTYLFRLSRTGSLKWSAGNAMRKR